MSTEIWLAGQLKYPVISKTAKELFARLRAEACRNDHPIYAVDKDGLLLVAGHHRGNRSPETRVCVQVVDIGPEDALACRMLDYAHDCLEIQSHLEYLEERDRVRSAPPIASTDESSDSPF